MKTENKPLEGIQNKNTQKTVFDPSEETKSLEDFIIQRARGDVQRIK